MLTGKNRNLPGCLPPDRRKTGFSLARAVGAYIPKVAGKVLEKHGFHSTEIMTQWPQIAGPEIGTWTKPERIRWPRVNADALAEGEERPGGTLTLRVEPARALDVEYRTAEVVERINRYFGYRAVAAVKLIQAPLAEETPSPLRHVQTPNHELPSAEPMPKIAAVEQGLHAALAKLWSNVSSASRR